MNPTKRIATYARVSTARQEEEQTVKTQQLVLKEYADKNGCPIVKEYTDEGWSGDILARPSLDELRTDAKKKMWDAVLIYDPDRLARRYSYQELVMDELREAGIEIIFITVTAPKNSEEKILHGVRGLFAEYERAKIAERFRLGKIRKVKDGHMLISEAPYGYRYIKISDGKPGYYEINEVEAKVVKEIFNWVAFESLTLRKIVMRLHVLGIKPRWTKREVWSYSTISDMLKNSTYIGEAKWGKTMSVVPQNPKNLEKYRKMKKTSKQSKPESEWLTVSVPAIIDKEIFYKVKEKQKDNVAFATRNSKYNYLLTGKIFCLCGKRRLGQGRKSGTGLMYRCTDRLRSFPLPPTCKLKGIPVPKLDQLVWDKISELMCSEELMTIQVSRLIANGETKPKSKLSDVATLENEIEKLKLQENRYNQAYGGGVFSLDKLQEYVVPIRNKIVSIQSQIVASQEQEVKQTNGFPKQSEIHEFAHKAMQQLRNLDFEARRAIVLQVIDKVAASKLQVYIAGCIPMNEIAVLCTNDRDSQDTIALFEGGNNKSIPFEFTLNFPHSNRR